MQKGKGRTVERKEAPEDTPGEKKKKDPASKQVAKEAVQILGAEKKDGNKEGKKANKKEKNARKGKGAAGGKKFNVQEKAKVRKKKKSCLEKVLNDFGIGFGNVVLRDPRAIEAAQALNLSPSHLR